MHGLLVCQILKLFPESRILACAPSNSAADLLLQRVMQHTVVPKSQMMRLNAFGRSILSLPKDIKVHLQFKVICLNVQFQKISIPMHHAGSLAILRGRVVSKAKILEAKYEAN